MARQQQLAASNGVREEMDLHLAQAPQQQQEDELVRVPSATLAATPRAELGPGHTPHDGGRVFETAPRISVELSAKATVVLALADADEAAYLKARLRGVGACLSSMYARLPDARDSHSVVAPPGDGDHDGFGGDT